RGAAQRPRAVPEPAGGLPGQPDLRRGGGGAAGPRGGRGRGGGRGGLAGPRPGAGGRRGGIPRGGGGGEGAAPGVGPRPLCGQGASGGKGGGGVWERKDLAGDGTHPSPSGRQKVAEMLLAFFKTDPLAGGWFGGK